MKLDKEQLIKERRTGYIRFSDEMIFTLSILKDYVAPISIISNDDMFTRNESLLYCASPHFMRVKEGEKPYEYVATIKQKENSQEIESVDFRIVLDYVDKELELVG